MAPMCTVLEALPASIWPAMARALLIGIEKACVWDCPDEDGDWLDGDCSEGDWLEPPNGSWPELPDGS